MNRWMDWVVFAMDSVIIADAARDLPVLVLFTRGGILARVYVWVCVCVCLAAIFGSE
jgi:hypothetical protein